MQWISHWMNILKIWPSGKPLSYTYVWINDHIVVIRIRTDAIPIYTHNLYNISLISSRTYVYKHERTGSIQRFILPLLFCIYTNQMVQVMLENILLKHKYLITMQKVEPNNLNWWGTRVNDQHDKNVDTLSDNTTFY